MCMHFDVLILLLSDASHTLIYGESANLKLICDDSCIDKKGCEPNIRCKCEEFDILNCPKFCDRSTGQCKGIFVFVFALFAV